MDAPGAFWSVPVGDFFVKAKTAFSVNAAEKSAFFRF